MFAQTLPILRAAKDMKYAVGGFNIYNLEGIRAVIRAAENRNSAVLLQIHPNALKVGGSDLMQLCIFAAENSSVPVGVHLDHCDDEKWIQKAISLRVSSIMADGSHLSNLANTAFVNSVTPLAHAQGIAIEAELGRISGTEDGLTVEDYEARMTDPVDAVQFVEETSADLLAVCIGNVHGPYGNPPSLDFSRLKLIRNLVDVPLVLHGASGLPNTLIRDAIDYGICKFNVNTEVRNAYLQTLQQIPKHTDLPRIMEIGIDAMQSVVEEKIDLFGSRNSAKHYREVDENSTKDNRY